MTDLFTSLWNLPVRTAAIWKFRMVASSKLAKSSPNLLNVLCRYLPAKYNNPAVPLLIHKHRNVSQSTAYTAAVGTYVIQTDCWQNDRDKNRELC
jgi:hypothetical protein